MWKDSLERVGQGTTPWNGEPHKGNQSKSDFKETGSDDVETGSGSGCRPVADSCKYGYELSSSINRRKFLGHLNDC
jgi:hypothetical protein